MDTRRGRAGGRAGAAPLTPWARERAPGAADRAQGGSAASGGRA
jgi:hypothetical protein